MKILSRYAYMTNFEYFADLLIGYSYIQLNSYKKAYAILSRVEKAARDKGLNAIVQISAYLSSILNIKQDKYDIAYGILSNSDIQMEKNPVSDYLVLLNKINMNKILCALGQEDNAKICFNQAKYIIQKYNLDFNVDNN